MRRKSLKDAIVANAGVADAVSAQAEAARLRGELASLKARYAESLRSLAAAGEQAEVRAGLAGIPTHRIPPKLPHKSRAPITAVLVCSDWHVEEFVDPDTVPSPTGRTNHYNLAIAKARVEEMTRRAIDMLHHEAGLAKVGRVVIAALGDFITGNLHEDVETQLHPLAATRYAGELLSGVINAVASQFPEVIVATCVGNHGRTTKKPQNNVNLSYEQNLYLTMSAENRLKNVTWQVGGGYHNWVNINGFLVRLHHGDAIKSNGAIGGFSIAANKKIAQWNRVSTAYLDIFGHHHSFSWNYGRYVSNGSLIGWNAFANLIGASFEPPTQACVIVDSIRGVTRAYPIFCEQA